MAQLLLPPTILLLLAVGGLALLRRAPRWGVALLVASVVATWALATPLVSGWLLRAHETAPPVTAADARRADAIVVLGADVVRDQPELGGVSIGPLSLERLRYAARLQRDTGLPVLTSGGRVRGKPTSIARLMAESLEQDFRVPVRWREELSGSTAANAAESARLLRPAGVRTVLLVTHAWHMPRARAAFERAGLEVVPAPTRFTPAAGWTVDGLLPSVRGLSASYYALHEGLGRVWYAVRGLPPTPAPDAAERTAGGADGGLSPRP